SPLRLGLGLRLPPGLSAPHPHAAATGPRYAGAGHHSHGEPTGHPRRGRPAGPGHRHAARLTGTVLTAAGGGTRALPVAALRLGGPSTLTIAWLGDRVRTDRGRGRTGDGVPVRGGARRRRL